MDEVDLVLNGKRRQQEMIRETQHYQFARAVESAQPRSPRIFTRISAYLRGKLHTQLQTSARNALPAAEPIHSVK